MAHNFFKQDTPHGLVKRIMYKKYMQAFIPITLRTGYSAVIIDGFAGPGRYRDEWPREIENYGSPLIALMVALNFFYKEKTQKEKLWGKPKEENVDVDRAGLFNETTLQEREPPEPKVTLYFIEKKAKYFEALKVNVAEVLNDFFPNPDRCYTRNEQRDNCEFTSINTSYPIVCKLFKTKFSKFNPEIAFLRTDHVNFHTFLDPFGYTHTPLVNVKQFLGENKSLFITFMSSYVDRFAPTCKETELSDLFGRDNLHADYYDDDHETNTSHLTDYEALLKFMEYTFRTERVSTQYASGAEKYTMLYKSILGKFFETFHPLSFEMRKQNDEIIYHLIFACDGEDNRSLKAMKEAMNRCTQEDGTLAMSDYKFTKNNNILDLGNNQDEGSVANAIFKEFEGKTVRLSKIETFVLQETPSFVFRKGALHLMLTEPNPRLLQVTNGEEPPVSPPRRGTFPKGTDWLITFRYDIFYPELDIWDI